MIAMKKIIYFLSILLVAFSCIEDMSKYDYKEKNDVTFLSLMDGYSVICGENVEMTAPVKFKTPFENEADIDKNFDIIWYADADSIAIGYKIRHTFEKVGGYSINFKVIDKSNGCVYLSERYPLKSNSSISWGWMLLSDFGDEQSSISFIQPVKLTADYRLERAYGIEDGIGTGPIGLDYYYVLGSIQGSYVSGLPKVIVNQKSGTVTLDARSLQKDKWMRDEFESGSEPESDFVMTGFAYKSSYYLISTSEGNVYVRAMHRDYEEIPYYGTYASMPFAFDGGADITLMQPFQNVTYWAANEDKALLYDSLNSRFLVFVSGGYGDDYESYSPKVVYLSYYDEEGEFDPSVPKVDNLGSGTKCLAAGAYEMVGVEGEYNGIVLTPKYVALLDLGGTGNYQVYQFSARPLSVNSHIILTNTMDAFSGAGLINEKSVIRMSTNFEKNPYFYFTDGGTNLYAYNMSTKSHALIYTAPSRITHLCSSPVVCEFKEYGGNPETPNWRMAVGQENGTVSIISVSKTDMVKAFEGSSPNLELKRLTDFGTIKDITWATNFEGEY